MHFVAQARTKCGPKSGLRSSFLPAQHFVDLDKTWLKIRPGAHVHVARATLLALMGVSDRFHRRAVRVLIALAQLSRYFVRVGSLPLWRGADPS